MEGVLFTIITVVAGLFFTAIPVVIVGLVIWYATNSRRRTVEQWGTFAHHRGLHLTPGSFFVHPSVTGVYARFHVDLRTVTRGSGDSSSTYTVMNINLPVQNGLVVSFYKEGFLSKLGKAIGTQDVQVGDPMFDEAFMIKSNSPPHVPHLLTPDIRQYALAMRDAMDVSLKPGKVTWEQYGTQSDPRRLGNVLDMLVLIGRKVLEMEAPHLLEQEGGHEVEGPQTAGTPGRGAPSQNLQTHLLKMSKCPNCGGKLEWDPEKTTDIVRCSYCGVSTKIKLL